MKQRPRGMTFEQVIDHYSEHRPGSTCHYWTGPPGSDGYGNTTLPGTKECRPSRAVWERAHGPIPAGLQINHTCNRGHLGCIELNHLYLGTQKDNGRDMAEAGTMKGVRHGRAKLNDAMVAAIRAICASGMVQQKELAAVLNVTPPAISYVHRQATWPHVTAAADPELVAGLYDQILRNRA